MNPQTEGKTTGMNGLIHIYTGNGKGKTTAATGLAVRARGRDKKVVFAQFLKSGSSGELISMEKLDITLVHAGKKFGWVYKMDDETKALCKNAQEAVLSRVREIICGTEVDVVILDEALDALSLGMLDEDTLKSFLINKPPRMEIVLTGRPVPPWLFEIADYLSDVTKVKHPFTDGIKAREGIEY